MKWRILFIMAIIVLGLQFSTASKAMRARVSIGTELVYQNGVPGFDLSLSLLDFDVSEYKQNYTIFLISGIILNVPVHCGQIPR